MIISVASGKGGTGKTTVACAVALSAGYCQFFDFDVEAPNAFFLLKPQIKHIQKITIKHPVFLTGAGTSFTECADFCNYHAIAVIGSEVIFFPELCHGCGGCLLVGPEGAVREKDIVIGEIKKGTANPAIDFFMGDLKPSNMRTTNIQAELEGYIDRNRLVIIDCPAGTSCSMVAAVKKSQYCILVTEPTPFGLNDLLLSIDVLNSIGIPFGVIINRDGVGNADVENYCIQKGIEILTKIPNHKDIAELYSKGEPITDFDVRFKSIFSNIILRITGK